MDEQRKMVTHLLAAVSAGNLGQDQPLPVAPDAEWIDRP
jgi:hypothetical protein